MPGHVDMYSTQPIIIIIIIIIIKHNSHRQDNVVTNINVERTYVNPYSYLDGWNRFEETQLPPKEAFKNDLTIIINQFVSTLKNI
jgi:hypothetical protein